VVSLVYLNNPKQSKAIKQVKPIHAIAPSHTPNRQISHAFNQSRYPSLSLLVITNLIPLSRDSVGLLLLLRSGILLCRDSSSIRLLLELITASGRRRGDTRGAVQTSFAVAMEHDAVCRQGADEEGTGTVSLLVLKKHVDLGETYNSRAPIPDAAARMAA
jgi:hypothetical protein